MDTDLTAGQKDEQPAAVSDGCVDLEQWPDALIRAVAATAPELFRSGDPFACREQDLRGYARGLALVSLEDEDIRFVDLDAYTAAVKKQLFRRVDVDGEAWFVAHWAGRESELDAELPISFESLSVEEWPDGLVEAVGRQSPALLRTPRGDAWALAEGELGRFARYWLFEGYCDPMLYHCIDLDRYQEELRDESTAVTTSAGDSWYVRVDKEDSDSVVGKADDEREGLRLLHWPDELVTAVAATLGQAFRSNDYESILAVPDEHLNALLDDWARGRDEEVAKAGGPVAWHELVIREDFRVVDADGRRWWVYICDWNPAAVAADA